MQEGLLIALAGMAIVFASLGALLLLMWGLSRLLRPGKGEGDK